MSSYRTLHITRTTAVMRLMAIIFTATNEQLGDMMDTLLREQLYNCNVVPDGVEPNDDEVVRG